MDLDFNGLAERVHLYEAGFPCQPQPVYMSRTLFDLRYSRLHRDSMLMGETDAKVLDDVIMAMIMQEEYGFLPMPARVQPLAAVLENVYGVLQVINEAPFSFLAPALGSDQEEVVKSTSILQKYDMAVCKCDAADMGEPCARRRTYILFFEEATCQVLKVLNLT